MPIPVYGLPLNGKSSEGVGVVRCLTERLKFRVVYIML